MSETSYFPVRIRIGDSAETRIVRNPMDLPNGTAFNVIETRVREPDLLPEEIDNADTLPPLSKQFFEDRVDRDGFTIVHRMSLVIPRSKISESISDFVHKLTTEHRWIFFMCDFIAVVYVDRVEFIKNRVGNSTLTMTHEEFAEFRSEHF